MKTALSIWNSGNKGKTETLREFANLLLATYPTFTPISPVVAIVPVTGDFRLVVQINGKIIGIESQGDPVRKPTVQKSRYFYSCNLVCKTKLH